MNPNETLQLTNAQLYASLIGFFLPVVLDVFMTCTWSRKAQSIFAFLACVVAALGTTYFAGQFNPQQIATTVLVVITSALASYKALWNPTGVSDRIKARVGITDLERF